MAKAVKQQIPQVLQGLDKRTLHVVEQDGVYVVYAKRTGRHQFDYYPRRTDAPFLLTGKDRGRDGWYARLEDVLRAIGY